MKKVGWVVLFFLLAVMYVNFDRRGMLIAFVDEQDNIALGKYLLQGELLYKDLFSHHQPLAYAISAGIQKVTNPNSIYLVIKYHRLLVMVWSGAWLVWLYLKFGWRGLGFGYLFELMKEFWLGQVFLAESLVVYPVVYLCWWIMEKKKKVGVDPLILGITWGFIVLMLAPMWPLMALVLVVVIRRLGRNLRAQLMYGLGILIPLMIALRVSDVWGYVQFAIGINALEYVPAEYSSGGLLNILKAFLSILIVFVARSSESLLLVRILAVGVLVVVGWLVSRSERNRGLMMLMMLGLANVRYVVPGSEIYSGFHLIVWYGLLIALFMWGVGRVVKSQSAFVSIIMMILLVLSATEAAGSLWERLKRSESIENAMFINYATDYEIGEALRVMGNKDDRLFVAPDGWLIYWQSDLAHASYMINYYPWMRSVKSLRNEVEKTLNSKPSFVYYDESSNMGLERNLAGYLLLRKNDRKTNLYIASDKYFQISEEQKQHLEYLGFAM